MKVIIISFFILLFYSCSDTINKNELIGRYTPICFKNNYDTLTLINSYSYHRKVYDKNKKLVLNMMGNWSFKSPDIITFENYYPNVDDDLIKFPKNATDTNRRIKSSFCLYRNNGVLEFIVEDYIKDKIFKQLIETKPNAHSTHSATKVSK